MLLTSFSFWGCDIARKVKLNDLPELKIHSLCGTVTLNARQFMGDILLTHSIDISKEHLSCNLDSLLMDIEIDKKLMDRNNRNKNKIHNKNKFSFTIYPKSPIKDREIIRILPCAYLKCNGVNLIQDTITIKL